MEDNKNQLQQIEQLLIEESPCVKTKDFLKKPRNEQIQDFLQVFNASISVSSGVFLCLNLSVNFHFAGSLEDENILGGIGLCIVIFNCLGLYLTFGLNQGYGSLAARAHGSNSPELMQNYYTKALATLAMVMAYLIVLAVFLEGMLIAIGQDEDISHYAQVYFFGILPGIACLFYFDLARNVFNSIGYFNQPLYMQFVQLIIQYFLCIVLVSSLELGLTGIIIATNISYAIQVLLVLLYAKLYTPSINLVPQFSLHSVSNNYQSYIVYCLNISLPNVVDSFCFEFNSILIGSLKINSQFSAHVIASNLSGLLFSFPLGLGNALCTLISNAVGEKDDVKAKNYFKISYFVGITFAFAAGLIFQLFGEKIGYLYTNDQQVVEYFVQVINLLTFFLPFDYLQGAQSGIMKALGEGRLCVKYFIICFYLIGNSMSCTFGFYFDFQLIGFWIGLIIAIISIFLLQTRFLTRISWKYQIQLQYNHLMNDKKALEESAI